jgi:hypothetical protein
VRGYPGILFAATEIMELAAYIEIVGTDFNYIFLFIFTSPSSKFCGRSLSEGIS